MENKKYFYGQEISEYGVQHNRVDYRALAKSFDAVLCNDITKLFYSSIGGEYTEPEQVNGIIDNSAEIEELKEQIEILENTYSEAGNLPEDEKIEEQIEELQEQIEELECEQEKPGEIFQYYIIDYNGYNILKDFTDEIIYYIDSLDMYIWGVTHLGTSWDYVLTDIKIAEEEA